MVQLYGLGILQPQNAPAALQLLSLMDFEGKDKIIAKVSENGTLQQRLARYQQIALDLAKGYGPEVLEKVMSAIESGMPRQQNGIATKSMGQKGEDTRMDRARDAAQERSQPT